MADGRRVGTVVAAVSLEPYEHTERQALIASLALSAVLLAVVIAAAAWVLRAALRPVARMTADAEAWSERDLDRRFAVGEPYDELTRLAATLDGLLDRIAASLRHERRVSAELSHELRTPLTKITAEAELALRRERQPESYRESLVAILRSARQLTRTVDTLMAAARQEATGGGRCDVRDGARRAVDACAPAAAAAGLAVEVHAPAAPVRAGVDEDVLERILQPVVENACRYGRTRVEVEVGRDDGQVVVQVRDDGPGLSADELERVFEPGVRGSAADAGAEAGAGLGLALSRRLARASGGRSGRSPTHVADASPCASRPPEPRRGLDARAGGGGASDGRPASRSGIVQARYPNMRRPLPRAERPLTLITYAQAATIGFVQGVTELFPISSLGHAVIAPKVLGWDLSEQDRYYLTFLVATHLATALVLLGVFWSEWKRILAGLWRSLRERRIDPADTDARLGWLVVLATIPTGILGLIFESPLRRVFADPTAAAIFLMINGLILLAGERLRRRAKTKMSDVSPAQAVGVGVAQSAALLPGISRAGITMVAGLRLGLGYEQAARFAFLLATPIILLAALLKLPDLFGSEGDGIRGPALVGALVAGAAAYLAVRFLLRYFETQKLWPFGVYCLVAGAATLAYIVV